MELWLPNIVHTTEIESAITEWLKTNRPYQHLIQQQIHSLWPQLHSHQTLYAASVHNKALTIDSPVTEDGTPYKVELCNICYGEDNVVRTTLPCNHSFHLHCVLKWFRTGNTTCPMCRMDCKNIY